ncbi:aspartyl-phosphate phosphatase Spo0E family protein [Robertmurraya korlensis]|uniref:aspartyl-phosphate phosphatase Spo0E family protein n=1 Tax=Robertmurraya korlensis TaxID=519977 RepID=UPI000824F431|nr:aspartyl-phosphate phosphatase Spo0E family protein [Robertmurraya korlensis]
MIQTLNKDEKLMESIEELRTAMIESSRKKGIKNMDTVRLSQELDKLILTYQQRHVCVRPV